MAVTTHEPPRASQAVRDARSRQRALEGDLDNILAKALKKDSAERYASVVAFAEDLRRYLRHEPVQARADTVAYRVTKFMRRHRGGVLATALAVAGLLGTTAVAIVEMLEARAQRDMAEFEARKNSAQSELTEFLLGDSLSRAPQDAVRQRLDRAREMVQQRFRTEPLIEARLLLGLSGRYVDTGNFAGSTETLREVEAIAHRIDDPHLNADVACGRAQDETEDGDLATARRELDSGLANMHRMSTVPPSLAAECAISSAYIAQAEGDFASSVSDLRSAVHDLEGAGLLRTARYQSVANELARALYMTGDYRASWDVQRQVLARAADLGRTDTAGYYAEVSVGASSLRAGGQPRRALELLDTALQHARQASPDAQVPYYLEGGHAIDRFSTGAIAGTAEALDVVAQAAEKDGAAHMALSYRVEALKAALAQHDVRGAQARWSQLAPVETQLLANSVPDRDKVTLLLAHARVDLAREQATDAERELDRAASVIASRRQASDSQQHDVELLRTELAFATRAYAEAERHAQATLDLAEKEAIDPASSAWVGEALVWRARSEAALGRTAAAASSAREALPHLEQNLDAGSPLIAAAKQLAKKSA
jgi:serine/threonine-protein kinase